MPTHWAKEDGLVLQVGANGASPQIAMEQGWRVGEIPVKEGSSAELHPSLPLSFHR